MYQYLKSPLMLFSFSIVAGFIHWLLLSPYSPLVSYEYDAIPLFTASSFISVEKAFSGGPLIYFFYHLFGRLFHSPETALNVANSVLMATLTYTLLICAVRLGIHSYSLIIQGIWIIISPTIHHTLVHYPHLALGVVFYLLLFLSLMRKHYFLILVYLIHLFFTHPVLGFISLIMSGIMLINRRNIYYLSPMLITIAAIFIVSPYFTGIENFRTIFTFTWHITGSLFTGYLTH